MCKARRRSIFTLQNYASYNFVTWIAETKMQADFLGKNFRVWAPFLCLKVAGRHTHQKIWLLHIQIAIVCSVRLNIWYDQILDITAHNDYILNSRNVGKLQKVDTRPFSPIFRMGMGTRLRRANHRLVLLCIPVVLQCPVDQRWWTTLPERQESICIIRQILYRPGTKKAVWLWNSGLFAFCYNVWLSMGMHFVPEQNVR